MVAKTFTCPFCKAVVGKKGCKKWGCKSKTKAKETTKDQKGLLDSKGRNRNGIRYRENGTRIWSWDKDD